MATLATLLVFLSLGVFLWAVARQASSLPMPRRVMCIAVTVAALSLAVLSSACSQEQISEQLALVRSAEQGDAAAQTSLGFMYRNGEGVPQDYGEALRWYRLAADQGHASAQVCLGSMYASGEGVPQDDSEALHWYRLAADQGYAGAQFNIGIMYANGEGVPQDYGEGVRWYRLAADQGFASAQYNLSGMYLNGRGVPQDDGEAVRWHRLAADQGHAGAQHRLSLLYGTGRGVPQDYVTAHMWANLAAEQGNEDARKMRDTLAEVISAGQISGASQAERDRRRVPQAAPCIPTELSPAALELVRLYEELHTFKDDSEFLRVGFVRGGP